VPVRAPSAGCGPATTAALTAQSNVVEATVTDVSGQTVTLRPKRVFRGGQFTQIQVEMPAGKPPAALGLPSFSNGSTYLLAVGTDGSLAGCGLSGVETHSLENLYTSAFGG
jgi:hypothetical protein